MPNRWKREIRKNKAEAREGLRPEEISVLDAKEEREAEIRRKASVLHREMFPEEYDHIYDSIADASDRAHGKNPMCREYPEEVNARRVGMGVAPLSENGMATSDESYHLCVKIIRERYSSCTG